MEDKDESQKIIAGVGIIVFSVITLVFAGNLLTAKPSENKDQALVGSSGQLGKKIANLTDKCWEDNMEGLSKEFSTCYRVNLNLQDQAEIDRSLVVNYLRMPEEHFEMVDPLSMSTDKFVVKYVPGKSPKVIIY